MAQQIKGLATKFDDLSLIPGTHMMGGESSDLYTHTIVPNPSPPHHINNLKIKICDKYDIEL